MLKIKGTIVSQPLTIKHNDSIMVMVLVKNTENGKHMEFYYRHPHFLTSLSKLCCTLFSRIALSAIGDEVEIETYERPCSNEICEFTNLTQRR